MAENTRPLPNWKEHETIEITNPTKQDFSARYNGELYTLPAGVKTFFPRAVAFHLAKHLSNLMLEKEADVLREQFKESVYVPQEAILMNHDNPSRRIALYDILGDRSEVERFFVAIPLKAFIGDMANYEKHVAKKEAKLAPTPVEHSTAQSKKSE